MSKTQFEFFKDEKMQRGKSRKKEEKVQLAFCKYIKTQYPNVIFSCDVASGMKLPVWIAASHKAQRSSRGFPDFFMAKATPHYQGFFLELKKDRDEVYKKDGEFKKKKSKIKAGKLTVEVDHIQEQWDMIIRLRKEGYYADFGLGLDDCIEKVDNYLKQSFGEKL